MNTGGETATVWGLDGRALHDRFWAARGLRVVRRASGVLGDAVPGPFLLLDPDELVLFEPPRATDGLVSVRVVEDGPDGYAERVIADGSNRLVTLRRLYSAQVRRECRAMITADPALAWLWHQASDRRAGMREIRRGAGLERYTRVFRRGRFFDACDPSSARRFVTALMRQWHDVDAVCADLSAPGAGVWIHRTATVEPGVRFIGPVWVGAGAHIPAGRVVAGPRVIPDRTPVAPTPVRSIPVSSRAAASPAPSAGRSMRRRLLLRRVFDVAFSLAVLLLVAPLFPLIMLAIWLDDGRPFFFAHTRQTMGGRNFVCFKFRTMCKNAEHLKAQLAGHNVCDGPQFHVEDDPRLTRVGRLLRRCHLDELPQFVNVLLGHMSVIGPRPSPDDENQFCPAWRDARLSVRPGVTGLWQVSRTRAPQSDFQEWIRHDLDYVEQQSWRLDLMIIYKTTRDILGRLCTAATR